ncbi:MAG TPA: alcohol dehydrogenase catalytic domain-containing protein [Acidimicrobiales bacterium]
MATMTAYQLTGWQKPAEFVEVEVPRPRPGEVLVKVAGVGLCHSDLLFLDVPEGFFAYELPFTLGHEIAGWVDEVGEGVDDLGVGDGVVVKSRVSCGHCTNCLIGYDNYCMNHQTGLGAGEDGGLAPFVVAQRRCLVPLPTLDPRHAGPLADAGCTSYHVVKKAVPKLAPGSAAVVIGAGGLGGYAIQYLGLMTTARVIVVDVAPHRLELARELGVAETVLADAAVADTLHRLTQGQGAQAVFDFVGTDETMALAFGTARTLGSVAVVGAGGGSGAISWASIPRECEVFIPMGGTIQDLHEVVALAELGALRLENELFAFNQLPLAYERLRAGDLRGRAVVTPNT